MAGFVMSRRAVALVTHAMCVICSQLSVNNGALIHSPTAGRNIYFRFLAWTPIHESRKWCKLKLNTIDPRRQDYMQEIQVKLSFAP